MNEYRFDQIAIVSTEKKKPTEADKGTYVGLEHLSSDTFEVVDYGAEVAPKGEKLVMRKGDVLFGKRRAYQKKVGIAPCDGIFSAHGMVLRPNEEIVDACFFPFFIRSDVFLNEAIRISVGSLSPTVNWRDLRGLKFRLPSLDQQRKVAELLWVGENLKSTYRELLVTCGEQVKSRFIEMFGSINQNPTEWHTLPLDEVAPVDYSSIPATGMIWQLNLDAIESESGEILIKRYIQASELQGSIGGFKANQVLYSKLRPYLNKVVLPDESGVCTTELLPLSPSPDLVNRVYLASVLRSSEFVRFASSHSNGAKMPRVDMKAFKKFEVPLPPLSLQQKFADFVHQVDKSKFTLKRAIEGVNATMTAILNQELGMNDVQ